MAVMEAARTANSLRALYQAHINIKSVEYQSCCIGHGFNCSYEMRKHVSLADLGFSCRY